MQNLARIKRCWDLDEVDVTAAVASRAETRLLLAHLAAVSSPESGGAKIIVLLARLATDSCDWIDGDLCVEMAAQGASTAVEVLVEIGGGQRERVFGGLVFRFPIAEMTRALDRAPHMAEPLVIASSERDKIVLMTDESLRSSSIPAAPVRLHEDSLSEIPAAPSQAPQLTVATPAMPLVTSELAKLMNDQPSHIEDVGDIDVVLEGDDIEEG